MTSQHNDRDVRLPLAGTIGDVDAADPRHLQVEQQQIEWALMDQRQGCLAVLGGCDLVATPQQQITHGDADRLFVVHHKNMGRSLLHELLLAHSPLAQG